MMGLSPLVDAWEAGAELDAEIARRVFGRPADSCASDDVRPRSPMRDDAGRDDRRYSTEIGDAWKIIDELHARGYLVRVTTHPKDSAPRPSRPDTRVACRIEQTARGVHRRVADADAATAPLAICRAALRVFQEC